MIIVFGALSINITMRVDDLPKTGENISAKAMRMLHTGKAGNQAFAAARMGEKTAVVGCVGDDVFGMELTDLLRRNGTMTSGVAKSTYPTGTSLTLIDNAGKSQVIYNAGANLDTDHGQVPDEILLDGNMLLLQTEIDNEENIKLLERASVSGVKTLMNLAPATNLSNKMLGHLDYLVINSREAKKIAEKLKVKSNDKGQGLAAALAKAGKLVCIVTSGPGGSIAVQPDGTAVKVEAYKIPDEDVKDMLGAGDCYCGTLAAALHMGKDIGEAMRYASVAASLSVRKMGTQEAYPYLDDVNSHLDNIKQPETFKV